MHFSGVLEIQAESEAQGRDETSSIAACCPGRCGGVAKSPREIEKITSNRAKIARNLQASGNTMSKDPEIHVTPEDRRVLDALAAAIADPDTTPEMRSIYSEEYSGIAEGYVALEILNDPSWSA